MGILACELGEGEGELVGPIGTEDPCAPCGRPATQGGPRGGCFLYPPSPTEALEKTG